MSPQVRCTSVERRSHTNRFLSAIILNLLKIRAMCIVIKVIFGALYSPLSSTIQAGGGTWKE